MNGSSDYAVPLKSSALPMFRLAGAPEKDKRQAFWDGSSANFMKIIQTVTKETLDWFDRYLGPVK